MTEPQQNETPVAVWYFIGATFAGVAPMLFFTSIDTWVRIVFLVISLALIGAGFAQLRRETGWGSPGRTPDDSRPDEPTP